MLSKSILVLVLVGVTFGKVYFEENFDDDSWKDRWVTSEYNVEKFGKFERQFEQNCKTNNTGLRTMEDDHFYALSTRFTPFSITNSTFVLQLSVKYEQKQNCADGYIKLYDCELEPSKMHMYTPYILQFGTVWCHLRLAVNYLKREHSISGTEQITDGQTHVYTLFMKSDLTYQILLDGEEILNGTIGDSEDQVSSEEHLGSSDGGTGLFPRVCGIGFRIYQSENGTIFDNILLADGVGAAERKREDIIDEIARCNKYSSVVDIASEDLERIIDCKRNFEFIKDNRTRRYHFLENFYKFMVPFNWSGNNTVITATAEYNKENCLTLNTIQLWVSFQPQNDNISVDIDSVLGIVNKANSMVSDTVTTIVINYGFLPLDNHTLPFVNYEVRKVREKLKALPFQAPKLGLQISDVNCQSKNEYIKELEIKLLDVLLITPMPHEKEFLAKNEPDRLMALLPCQTIRELLKGKITVFHHMHLSIDIDFEKGGYEFDEREFTKTSNIFDGASPLIHAEDKMRRKDMVDTKHVSLSKDVVNWLYRPVGFSKSHFGAVISWEENELLGSEKFASTFFESFQYVLIDVYIHDVASDNDDYLKPIFQRIANYLVVTKKQESTGDHYSFQSPKDNIRIQMSILVPTLVNDFNLNKRQTDKVISAAIKANEIFPGIVNAIFFDLLPCSRSIVCSEYSENSLKDDCLEAQIFANLSNILDYANETVREMIGNNTVSIGTIVDNALFKTMARTLTMRKECRVPRDNLDRASAMLCKIVVHHEDIVNFGGVKASQTIIKNLSICIAMSKRAPLPVYYHVNVIGCVGGHSNMTLIFEFIRLMENLNKWATTENTLLFTNAGAEMSSKCAENADEGNCKCGWWIKQDDEYQDKKTIARQLYEKAEDIKRENEKTTGVPKESQLWLWILIPIIVITLSIAACTGFFIHHYQVKYLLTKNEVQEFIKGRQTTRAEPVDEGDEAAESQTYNSDKYELPLSTFTIDISSNPMGSGEFGRVYRGSIRRGGAIIETAVKMANPSLVRKSHGYYLALKGLLSEIKILAYVGEHNHIVQLLGAYTKKVRKGEIAVFLELCQLGSLDKWLRSMKPQIVYNNELTNSTRESSSDISDIGEEENVTEISQVLDKDSSDELYRWAGEIASGMEFLASKKLVHADLATRNVLLTNDKVAKISDFGVSRRLYDYTEYVKQTQGALPWRWMAPESLCRMVFNEKSDIWAFGVTLWEMFTLGDMPYPGLTWQVNFSGLLERGLRLPEPKYNVKEIYLIMVRCWNISPTLRPTFSQIKSELNQI